MTKLIKKASLLLFAFTLITSNIFSAGLEIDYMESTCDTDAHAQTEYVTNGAATNLFLNPSMETWSAGDNHVPTSWIDNSGEIHIAYAKESTIVKVGTYSAKLTSTNANSADMHQLLENLAGKDIDYWKGKTVTLGVWCWSATANTFRVAIYDGVSSSISSYHPGDSAWHWLTATRTLSSSATTVYVYAGMAAPEIGEYCYFDGAVIIEGNGVGIDGDLNYLQSYSGSGAGNITQGTYSLKVEAAQTDSLNKNLTQTFSTNHNLTGVRNVWFDLKASRTGANVKFGLHDTGGTTTEITPSVITANNFQKVNWDLSGVSDANKDAIDKFIITTTNADSSNTLYVDYAEIAQAIDVFGMVN